MGNGGTKICHTARGFSTVVALCIVFGLLIIAVILGSLSSPKAQAQIGLSGENANIWPIPPGPGLHSILDNSAKDIYKKPFANQDVDNPEPLMEEFIVSYLDKATPNTDETSNNLADQVINLSKDHGTKPLVTLARLMTESHACHYQPGTQQVKRGSHGEYGISQVHPSWINKTINGVKITKKMLEDPTGNLKVGMLIYKMYENKPSDYIMALTHYNQPSAKQPNHYARRVNQTYQDLNLEWRVWAEWKINHLRTLQPITRFSSGL